MAALDDFVDRIVSRARIARSTDRDDLERELRCHFEDAVREAGGRNDETRDIPAQVCRRFGSPEEVGRALERVHRFERRAAVAADGVLLMSVSVLAVGTLIALLQLAIAASIGISPLEAFPWFRGRVVGFISLSLGYMSLYWEERLLKGFRLLPAFLLNLGIFAGAFALLYPHLRLHNIASAIPFTAGALVRLLQTTRWRRFWCLGTVLPTIGAYLVARRLLNIPAAPPWEALLFRWIGQTAACYLLTLVSRNHARWSRLAL
jgi:hypothetical protein